MQSPTNAIIILISSLFIIAGCSSGAIRVESQPEGADVLLSMSGQPPRKIGVTPMLVTDSNLVSSRDSFQLTLAKDGFISQSVVVPPSNMSREATVQIQLQNMPTQKNAEQSTVELQRVASAVSDIQGLLRGRRWDEAEGRITMMLTQYPTVATFHELMGTTLYLKKDLGRALASFRRASELNPTNLDLNRMINKIEGLRMPASGGER